MEQLVGSGSVVIVTISTATQFIGVTRLIHVIITLMTSGKELLRAKFFPLPWNLVFDSG